MREWISKLKNVLNRPEKRNRYIFFVGMAGMVLLLLSEFLPSSAKAAQNQQAASSQTDTIYEAQLESRLEDLIESINGAGRTKVMVTLETGEQHVYAVDTKKSDADSEQTHVLLDDGSALTETVCTPEIRGVAVVCEGGDQIHVVSEITQMLSALLGLSTSHISVTKMN